MRSLMLAPLMAAVFTFAQPVFAAAPVEPPTAPSKMISPRHAERLRREIDLHEQRARELGVVIDHDVAARNNLAIDVAILERHAREMRGAAAELRNLAREVGGRERDNLNRFADEYDGWAAKDEGNAAAQHAMVRDLDSRINSERSARDWHLEVAGRLRRHLDGSY